LQEIQYYKPKKALFILINQIKMLYDKKQRITEASINLNEILKSMI